MSGQESNKNISRRKFIYFGALIYSSALVSSCLVKNKKGAIKLFFSGANAKNGHLLRSYEFPNSSETLFIDTIIVGGGVAGLSAARWLHKNNKKDFLLFEMDQKFGGNAMSGKNDVSAYPYGAHYLPLPDITNKNLLDFLFEYEIITGYNNQNEPTYNEYYLCTQPHERFFYKGIWMDEMPPKEGLSKNDFESYQKFNALISDFKNATGNDHKPAFSIPLDTCSNDVLFTSLDDTDIISFLKSKGYNSDFLFWYLDYCCKDDFGTTAHKTSAWAAIHYFASRKGIAANAKAHELLTWPEGNSFLIKKLGSNIKEYIKTNCLVYQINGNEKNGYQCLVYDVINKKSMAYNCNQLIMATPQFINKKILKIPCDINWDEFTYYPWLVANITITNQQLLKGRNAIAWDNVLYNSKSLGYVNATHQHVNTHQKKTVITYYYNFSEEEAKKERQKIFDKDEVYWKNFIVNDLKKAHPTIEEIIESIDLWIWGHGMISPQVGFKNSVARNLLDKGFKNLHFVNSDVSGISIFEEAFHQGIRGAKKVLNNI